MTGNFAPFSERMRAAGLPEVAIRTFAHYYEQLAAGNTGLVPESSIEPVSELADAESLPAALAEAGRQHLSRSVIVKLNGGLGTSMGLSTAKSLLVVKNGLTFLDIIARQALHQGVPLVLMDSFNTQADSLAALAAYEGLRGEIPLDFLQHKIPKVVQTDLSPAECPDEPELAWCPPGHGDIYTALMTSGMLDRLLARGIEYAFVSNADNLGAVLDAGILGYFADKQLPFMMEVADRTAADRKGGHLAQAADGRLILRESAQCPPADQAAFQDIDRYRYFNTNNLWLHLPSLAAILAEKEGILGLPMIRNGKTLNPRDPSSTPVYQLETAMGSAIPVFAGAGAIRVPRSRFAPVKTTADLLGVRSDSYVLTADYRVVTNPTRARGALVIDLDDRFYRLIDDLEARFPEGPPSLIDCEKLVVRGDITFRQGIGIRGCLTIDNPSPEPLALGAGIILHGPC